MDIYSLIASLCGVVYVILASYNNRLCFVFGFIGAVVWCIADLVAYDLYFDAILQIFYAIMSIIGFVAWGKKKHEKPIKKFSIDQHGYFILIVVLLSAIMYYGLSFFSLGNFPVLDAITTTISIGATFVLINRYIDNWLYLLIANIIYLYIYHSTGAYIFVGMMLFYSVMSIIGYYRWRKIYDNSSHN